ncbi:uncharacterized protein MELLADRAFT_61408 [Melampsora larici-populina 98AG31]|uniref:Uncharacterized protein n=1 Tax=Melampsora larici-populina (strain 98AG31 / pathotype 3-4-7) TaxID=747676 RepID=F4RES3_MELLP|nr:uncharacterized protein MELLADRAFT_61408 [Melampsora larici-populina 98AG31]EGG09229.1 hypothetical protein MELLADRAFT_61408 [Melampsora larici-populina 98AG31]
MHNIFLGLLRHHGLNALGLLSKKKSTSSRQKVSEAEEDESDTLEQVLEDFDSDDGGSDHEETESQASECVGDQVANQSPSVCEDASPAPEDDLSLAFGSMGLEYNTTLDAEQGIHDDQSELEPFMGFSEDSVAGCEEEEEELSDYEEVNQQYNNIFNKKKHLNILREVIRQAHLPSWIGRVPQTVGSSKGGKLKADEWVVLYEVMIIPAFILFFHRKGHLSCITDHEIVRNTLHLISILKIVRRFEVQDKDLGALKYHIKSYRHGLSELFTSLSVTPNLHMLLHIPQVVRVFGPAPYWTAWSFEATNGSLAKIPTNNHDKGSREYTILNKWTTGQNMRCVLPDLCKQLPKKTAANLSKFLSPKCTDGSASAYLREGRGGPTTLRYNPKKNETLDYDAHLLLLSRMKEIYGDKAILSTDVYKKSQHNEDKILISRWVNQMVSVKCHNVVYSTNKKNPGNSIVLYPIRISKHKKGFVWGKINEIFMTIVRRDGNIDQQIWIDISRYATLTAAHQRKHGFTDWPYSGFSVVYDREKKKDMVRLDEIVGHGASWENPQGCFGIKEPTLLIINLSKTSCTAT